MNCRHCNRELTLSFVDLGSAPPSNAYLDGAALSRPEIWYPLRVVTCTNCWLVQTEDFAGRDAFFSEDYAYFSSFSHTWLKHSETYVEMMADRFDLDRQSLFVEVASNDGYLLQYADARGIRTLGVEPTASTAEVARAKGLDVVQAFFGEELARKLVADGYAADATAANNVLAHVPDINDFVAGFAILLKQQGIATFEFPHLLNLVRGSQFDTIYHEHYSYLSLTAVVRIFAENGLRVFDAEPIKTHGGSLRVYAQREGGGQPVSARVGQMLSTEEALGMSTSAFYAGFQTKAEEIADGLVAFLLAALREGRSVAGYGAAAKGNTLLNFAGVRPHLLPWVADRNPAKQGKFMPGSRIPIVNEEWLCEKRPDYIVILPWNLRDEVTEQLNYAREWGAQFVTAVPTLTVS